MKQHRTLTKIWNKMSIALLLCSLTIPQVFSPASAGAEGSSSTAATSATLTQVKVNVDVLNARSGPGLKYEIVGKVKQGVTLSVTQQDGQWLKVNLPGGKEGWVAGWLVVAAEEQSTIITVTSTVNQLNVRSGPSQSFTVIDQINTNETYPYLEERGNWIKIKLSGDRSGWVASWFVTKKVSSTQLSDSNQQPATSIQSGPLGSKEVIVQPSILNLRDGPSLESQIVGKLEKGTRLTVLEQKGDWLRVQSAHGTTGWVAAWLVEQPGQQTANSGPTVKILHAGTNIRSGPGTNYAVVHRANMGDVFPVLSKEGDWFKIRLANGETAYVAGWIVAAEGIANVQRPSLSTYLQGKTIVVDPGHGGIDNGATGLHLLTLEKDMNLQVSNILVAKLRGAGANVILTREDDRKIPLQTRVDIAIKNKADAFISIHHNTHSDSRINGTITYFYSDGDDRTLARLIQQEVVKRNGRQDLKARRGNFFVLRENPQLAVLVELGFLTNMQEEIVIRSKEFQERSAEGIFQGILLYFQQKGN